VDYGPGLEAYRFHRGTQYVHVVWTTDDVVLPVSVPALNYVASYDRDGNPLSPSLVGSQFQFQVGFEPIYIILSK
jgi:predicted membrane-bound mannosyltransferase